MKSVGMSVAIGACACLLALGCSDDDDEKARSPSRPGGAGGSAGRSGGGGGGASGTAGTLDAGAPDGGADAGSVDAGSADGGDGGESCVYEGAPLLDPADLPSCESATCQNAHCLARGLVSAEQAEQLADCDAETECVPDLLIVTLGQFLLDSCRSLAGAEGRCLSTCIPQVAAQLDALPRDVCDEGERCTPCFDPITGEETGACGQSCDPGAVEPPVTFPACCGELGVCVPDALVAEGERAVLSADSCEGDGVLCAPRAIAADPTAVPATCRGLAGGEGRCLPACLPSVAAQVDVLPSAGCQPGELCAPCFDPLTGEATPACSIGGDAPAEPPTLFAECCGGRSLCIPEVLVSEAQQSLLDGAGCASGELCAPREIATGDYQPEPCMSWGAEGRCLLACLPDVAAQRDRLARATCDAAELCVPCYDPIGGASTGACEIEGDQPNTSPPYRFETCCDDGAGNDLGTCVPEALVSFEDFALLSRDTCTINGFVCAPTELATGSYEPDACDSWLGAEGRCLPACLPDVAAQRAQLRRADCSQGELCVPCYDPVSSESTGACAIDDDAPAQAPRPFPTCCPTSGVARGTCVPSQAAGAQADSLPVLDCETKTGDADAYVCAPNERIADPEYQFPSCETTCGSDVVTCALALVAGVTGEPGACVPSCMLLELDTPIGDNAADLFGRSSCAAGEDCAPCVNPDTDEPTGLCD